MSWRGAEGPVTESLVLRVKPTQHTVFLEQDFEAQHLVLRTLGEHTAVPVPPVRWFEANESYLGAPFFVMDRVDGRAPEDSPPYTQQGWLLAVTRVLADLLDLPAPGPVSGQFG